MYNTSVLDKVQKPGIVAIACPEGNFQHVLDYHESSSPRSDKSLVLDIAFPLYSPSSRLRVYDRSPFRNIGTIVGATFIRDHRGLWLLSFDGDDKITIPDHASLDMGTGDFAIAVCVKTSNVVTQPWVVSKWAAGNTGYGIDITNAGKVRANIGDIDGFVTSPGNADISDGVLHLFKVNFDRSDNATVYIDDAFDNIADISDVEKDISTAVDLTLGVNLIFPSSLTGSIGEVWIKKGGLF